MSIRNCCSLKCQGVYSKYPTNSKEQSPSWYSQSFSGRKKISAVYGSQRFIYSVHTSPPLTLILSQINAVHAIPPYFFKICFNEYTLVFVKTGIYGDDFGRSTSQQS